MGGGQTWRERREAGRIEVWSRTLEESNVAGYVVYVPAAESCSVQMYQ